ncbi:chaplin family protein [Streptomyces fuscichromogenes]|uniref:chaplin family protein n=1 Tax=Streptomyces fuscichromogenes TaxID=1324013 RepID=UPI0037F1B457
MNACGNTTDVIQLPNPAFGNVCVDGEGRHAACLPTPHREASAPALVRTIRPPVQLPAPDVAQLQGGAQPARTARVRHPEPVGLQARKRGCGRRMTARPRRGARKPSPRAAA